MPFSSMRLAQYALIVCLSANFAACTLFKEPTGPEDTSLDNPLDPENPNFIPPNTKITSHTPADSVLNTHVVTFTWKGSCPIKDEDPCTTYDLDYRYWLDDGDTSKYDSTITSVSYELLSDTLHLFQVQMRYPSLQEENKPAAHAFRVDDVKGPGLMFYPRRIDVQQGEENEFHILAEEVQGLAGAKVVIKYDSTALEVIDVVRPDTLEFLAKGGNVLFFLPPENERVPGEVVLSVAAAGAEPFSVKGTGTLAVLKFSALKSGRAEFQFLESSLFRTEDNDPITINELVDGVVDAQ